MSAAESSACSEYEWLSAREAILRRPDTHVGATSVRRVRRVVLDATGTPSDVEADLSPALEKMMDEIVTNALDHKVRDDKMTELRIDVGDEGEVVVVNNGSKCIPTGTWQSTGRHVPEILFTELSAGSNLGRTNKHNVGGRNGVGASVTNILSARFSVRICNAGEGVRYEQTFADNAGTIEAPKLTKYGKKTSSVSISFLPDFAMLDMPGGMSEQARRLLVGRAVDAAACTTASVLVNGCKVAFRGFQAYALAFGGSVIGVDKVQAEAGGSGDATDASSETATHCGATVVVTDQASPAQQTCFVNGVRCTGRLLDAVLANVASSLSAKKDALPERQIKAILAESVSVFVTARVNMPSWTGQTKDVLDTPASKFGFSVPACKLIAKRIEAMDVVRAQVEMRRSLADGKEAKRLLKASGKNTAKIKKYEKATEVGRGKQCTLWIAEGDSAKAMIVSGFQVTGRKHHGVYPLRGKLLNVYDLSATEALKNSEISDLLAILQLDPARTYDAASARKLPYRLMVTTDQDDDGSHIFGLVMAVFYRFFPTLLNAAPGFVRRFVTPVVKVSLRGERSTPIEFFALSSYRAWAEARSASDPTPASVAYYKGLGTNTNEEAVAYFSNMGRYEKVALHTDASPDAMRTAFLKAKAAQRRDMLRDKSSRDTHDLYSTPSFAVDAFCDDELTLFWQADNLRSLPSAIDGLKPSQRKTVFTVLSGGASTKHKVAQLAADVAKKTNYHHGEAAMAAVIVNMAQSFFGSNNVPLLVPKGQFGNRHGERPSQPRYIYTQMQPYLRSLFHPQDDAVLERLVDEGAPVEPKTYVPVIPLLLVNGCEGIGTGFSTTIPPHAIGDVIDRCLSVCEGGADAPLDALVPFHHGFRGATYCSTPSSVEFVAAYEWVDATTVQIRDLPPGVKTNALKEALSDVACVREVVNNSTGESVDVRVHFEPGALPANVERTLKLKTATSTTNMHAFDATGKIAKFDSAIDLLRLHARVRLDTYVLRRESLLEKVSRELADLEAKIAFVESVVAGEVDVFRTKRAALRAKLGANADSLLAIPIDHLNEDGVAEWKGRLAKKEAEREAVLATTPQASWKEDLLALRRRMEEEGGGTELPRAGAPMSRPADAESGAAEQTSGVKRKKKESAVRSREEKSEEVGREKEGDEGDDEGERVKAMRTTSHASEPSLLVDEGASEKEE